MKPFRHFLLLIALMLTVTEVAYSQATLEQATATAPAATQPAAPLSFSVTYDESVASTYTGRVYVMLAKAGLPNEPKDGPEWFNTQPFFAVDVKDWKPGKPLAIDDTALGFPGKVSELPAGLYAVQAVMRLNLDSPSIGDAEGNAYTENVTEKFDGAATGVFKLHINKVVEPQPFKEAGRIKLAELKSDLLSRFHGRDIVMRAAVILPEGYDPASPRKYPALYWINGFGGDHHSAPMVASMFGRTGLEKHIVRVVLDPLCFGGHHVFVDSDNNGPRGTALVQEFIPFLEKTFNLMSAPTARFLSGHSSGGWSSLWLQVAYPDFFGGVWSIAPDPVDFHDFQRIDLYADGANMYVNGHGEKRPLARMGDKPVLWYESFARMEVVYGEGGQLRSFEWVFSHKGKDGLPEPLYDRKTGAVNADVANSWKRYDIRGILEENWTQLGPKLKGKLNVFMGDMDTFYLDGATKRLKASQEKLGSDAKIEVVAGRDHGSISDTKLRQRIDRELIQIFNAAHPEFQQPGLVYD